MLKLLSFWKLSISLLLFLVINALEWHTFSFIVIYYDFIVLLPQYFQYIYFHSHLLRFYHPFTTILPIQLFSWFSYLKLTFLLLFTWQIGHGSLVQAPMDGNAGRIKWVWNLGLYFSFMYLPRLLKSKYQECILNLFMQDNWFPLSVSEMPNGFDYSTWWLSC